MKDFLHDIFFILLLWTLIVASYFASGCTKPDSLSPYYDWDYLAEHYNMIPPFETDFSIMTPTGVRIDPSDNEIEPGLIDVIIGRVEKCMYDKFSSGESTLYIPDDIRRAAYCTSARPSYPIDRHKVYLKIPPKEMGWRVSPCSGQQLLSWETPDFSPCTNKGRVETDGCPCSWRAGVQDGGVIVATPNLYVFPDWFIRVHFGCLNPWGHPSVAACARPQTTLEGDLVL